MAIDIKKHDKKNWTATKDGIHLDFYKEATGFIKSDCGNYSVEKIGSKWVASAGKRTLGNGRTISAAMEIAITHHAIVFQAPKNKYVPNNRPKKGDNITVDPIRKQKDVKAIKTMLQGNSRNYLLFVLGINNGLRAGDLLKLRVKDVKDIEAGGSIKIKEGKTGKTNVLVINKTVHAAVKRYIAEAKPNDDDYLFRSRQGGNHPITIQSVNRLIKSWCKAINLKGNFGAHTLRKTWGYHMRVHNGYGFEIICKRFNHSSPAVTMRYLGISDKEVHQVLLNEV